MRRWIGRRAARRRTLSGVCAAGLLGASFLTPPGRAASDWVGERLGFGEPGGPPTVSGPRHRGPHHEQPLDSVVLAAGRAPDGPRFEFVLESFAEPARSDPPGKDFRHCLNIEWPDADVGRIHPQFGCNPEFPPARLSEAPLKVGGPYLSPYSTSYVQLTGLARSDVGRVQVVYTDEEGEKREGPVHFARVTGALRERAGADRPFGLYLAFLPPSIRYQPRTKACPERGTFDPEAIGLIAYDERGTELARERIWNIVSTFAPTCR